MPRAPRPLPLQQLPPTRTRREQTRRLEAEVVADPDQGGGQLGPEIEGSGSRRVADLGIPDRHRGPEGTFQLHLNRSLPFASPPAGKRSQRDAWPRPLGAFWGRFRWPV